jgi:opacity protein-like surface antigen
MGDKGLKKIFILAAWLITSSAHANNIVGFVNAGYGWLGSSRNADYVWMNNEMQNRYSIHANNDPVVGAGMGYVVKLGCYAVETDIHALYLHKQVFGINTPFVNWSSNVDTLNYNASGKSIALLLAPKIILSKTGLQPYLTIGAGAAWNRLSNYSESASFSYSQAAPTGKPFAAATHTSFAYEIGVGVQYTLEYFYHNPTLALDYRYINLGTTSLKQASDTSGQLNFGSLYSNTVLATLAWNFM